MPKKSLPDPPVDFSPESQATPCLAFVAKPHDGFSIQEGEALAREAILPTFDIESWLPKVVYWFVGVAERHAEEIKSAAELWAEHDRGGKSDNPAREAREEDYPASVAVLMCLHDHNSQNGESIIGAIGLDTFDEIRFATAVNSDNPFTIRDSITGAVLSVTRKMKEAQPPPAGQPTDTVNLPSSCGRLHVIRRGQEVKYPDKDIDRSFHFAGVKQWKDIELLMTADGQFVKMPKGFIQRWERGDAKELRKLAFESENKIGQKGDGRYRVLK